MEKFEFERHEVDFAACPQSRREHVTSLAISFCNLVALDGIVIFRNLTELRIHYCRELRDISALSDLTKLESITLYSTPKVFDCSPLALVSTLTAIELNGGYKIASIRGFENLPNLEYLALSRVKVADSDYQPIIDSKSLRRVFWHGGPFPPPSLKHIRKMRPDIAIGGNAVMQAHYPPGSDAALAYERSREA